MRLGNDCMTCLPGICVRLLSGGSNRCMIVLRHAFSLAEPRVVQSTYDVFHRFLEVVGTRQHIAHVKQPVMAFPCVRLTQHASDYLLYVDSARSVGKRRKDIGKRTVPSFFQGVHGDYVPHRAVLRKKVYALQFVVVARLYLDLLFRNTRLHKLGLYGLICLAVFAGFRLSLEKNDRTDVSSAMFVPLFLRRTLQSGS